MWGTRAAKRQHELLAARPPMLPARWALGWSGSWPGRPLHAAASRRSFPVLHDPPLKRRAKIMGSLRDPHSRSSPAAKRYTFGRGARNIGTVRGLFGFLQCRQGMAT